VIIGDESLIVVFCQYVSIRYLAANQNTVD